MNGLNKNELISKKDVQKHWFFEKFFQIFKLNYLM